MDTKEKATHTPGPWHRNVGPKYPIYDDRHIKVAYCLYGKFDQPSEEEAMANLRLIAAAPRLLATCEEELEALQVWMRAKLPVDVYEGVLISINKMTHAIAEAKGCE